ncbi:MAG: HAMP domain-containing sensor histidine kinase [Anaerolineae bacterium]
MKRKWPWILGLVYLSVIVVAGILVGAQPNYFRVTAPLGEALLVAGIFAGAVIGVAFLIMGLSRQRRYLLTEQRRLEAITSDQMRLIAAQQKTLTGQAITLQEQADTVREQLEFRRALNHELRNPITAIGVGVENLITEVNPATIGRLKSDVERVARLLDTVSALTRLEVNPIEFVPVHLDILIEQIVETIRATLSDRDCRLSVELPADPFPLPAVWGDEDLLFILFHNLLNNAVKFTLDGGMVAVRAFEADEYVVIKISDTGLGMSADDVRQAGLPFRRGQVAQDHKIPGSGLGLFQAWKIVARHRGKISLQSEVGKGSVITVQLPVSKVTAEVTHEA